MTVTIPESFRAFVAGQIASGNYADESALVCALLQKEQALKERETIEKRLLEAIAGESTEMTKADWKEIRDEVQRRHSARTGNRP